MDVVPGLTVRDLPEPPSTDEIVRRFGAPVYTFAPQRHLGEAGWGTVGRNDVLFEVSLSYSVYRNPENLEHPENFRDDDGSMLAAVRAAESANQPEWFTSRLRMMRYPTLWEAVRTVRLGIDADRPLAQRLAEHVNHVMINTREHRRRWEPGTIPQPDHEVTGAHAQTGLSLSIDGTEIDATIIDTDPDVVGWAALVDDVAVLVVFDRDFLPMVELRLVRRAATPALPAG